MGSSASREPESAPLLDRRPSRCDGANGFLIWPCADGGGAGEDTAPSGRAKASRSCCTVVIVVQEDMSSRSTSGGARRGDLRVVRIYGVSYGGRGRGDDEKQTNTRREGWREGNTLGNVTSRHVTSRHVTSRHVGSLSWPADEQAAMSRRVDDDRIGLAWALSCIAC
jgi:hypothetical protein